MIVCKHCGSNDGFYTRLTVKGTATFQYTNLGDYRSENSGAHEGIRYSGGINAYCNSCHKVIGKSEDLISGMEEAE